MLYTSEADALGEHRELYSGLIRLHVLHHAVKEPIFGLGMIEELGRHGYKVSPGMFYPLLHSMERKGLLRSWRRSRPNDRRVYRATAEGRKALAVAKRRVRELFSELFEDVLRGRPVRNSARRRENS
jgi:PadR family transcriptional regulator, regulatory protein PadR